MSRRLKLLGAALAAGALAVLAAVALAKSSSTLSVAANVHVTNTPTKAFRVKAVDTREAIAVGPTGYAVYTFQGESTRHIICQKTSSAKTNCWAFWPPVSAPASGSPSKAAAIKGRLGSFRNHGVRQLTLNGQPLYYFTPDLQSHNRKQAVGDELKTFGSIWHVVRVGGAAASPAPAMPATTTTSTTSSSPYGY